MLLRAKRRHGGRCLVPARGIPQFLPWPIKKSPPLSFSSFKASHAHRKRWRLSLTKGHHVASPALLGPLGQITNCHRYILPHGMPTDHLTHKNDLSDIHLLLFGPLEPDVFDGTKEASVEGRGQMKNGIGPMRPSIVELLHVDATANTSVDSLVKLKLKDLLEVCHGCLFDPPSHHSIL